MTRSSLLSDAANVSYLYSLYDALVSIAVPSDKARAVVDAMERDMGTTLATKPDLENLRLATKSDIENLRMATKSDIENLRLASKSDIETLRLATKSELENHRLATQQDLELLRRDITSIHRELKQDLVAMRQGIVIQLGSMMVVCFGLALAIVRLWIQPPA